MRRPHFLRGFRADPPPAQPAPSELPGILALELWPLALIAAVAFVGLMVFT